MTEEKIFERCGQALKLLEDDKELEANGVVIRLLDELQKDGTDEYPPLLSFLVSRLGLFPYLHGDIPWRESLVKALFTEQVGDRAVTLHREQSSVLKKLLSGESLVVSAPTSFGKSFIIDLYIARKHPKTVLIIVPTIALMDETRRRLTRRFSSDYKIVTNEGENVSERVIFIFPQERALLWKSRIHSIDLLVIDEFYKSSPAYEKDRSIPLMQAIIAFKRISKQCYFLAPNIDILDENLFTQGMSFLPIKTPTVVLDYKDYAESIGKDKAKKLETFEQILSQTDKSKSLVYVSSYPEMGKVLELVYKHQNTMVHPSTARRSVLGMFASWLRLNYNDLWAFPVYIEKGVGMHNGRMHRPLAQIQLQLFEEEKSFHYIVATSSIIEGVNTQAENVIVWSNKSGNTNLNEFSFRNICGRAGRMFRYFVGNVYILERPKSNNHEQILNIEIPKQQLLQFDDEESVAYVEESRTEEKKAARDAVVAQIGFPIYKAICIDGKLRYIKLDKAVSFINTIKHRRSLLEKIRFISELNPLYLRSSLKWLLCVTGVRVFININLTIEAAIVRFIKIMKNQWDEPFKMLLSEYIGPGLVTVEDYFHLERIMTYDLPALLTDVSLILKSAFPDSGIDLQPLIKHLASAFLPANVFQLEEYGLPRMLSQRIHQSGVLDMTQDVPINRLICQFKDVGYDNIVKQAKLEGFDLYILSYFFAGI